MTYRLEKDVCNQENLRNGFFILAKKVFDLDFEPWYQNGFWTEKYCPYTFFDGEKAIANVSVNQCDFMVNGVLKHYIQLGTVMTDPSYRKLGLSRKLMEEIEKDFEGKIDGFFLFANDSVLDFYPRFGFKKKKEYHFEKEVTLQGNSKLQQVPMHTKDDFQKMQGIILKSAVNGPFMFRNNSELDMFYLSQFMNENIFYLPEQNAYVIAEIEEDTAVIWDIFSEEKADLSKIIEGFGKEIKKVILLFTPDDSEGFERVEHHEDDTTLFIRGEIEQDWKEEGMFPPLCHA